MSRVPGRSAVRAKGWLRAHKWLLLRRSSQLALLLLFALGPWFGIWIVKGTLASSVTLGVLPLTDPFVTLQSLSAGHLPYADALLGSAILVVFYLLVGGRTYCAWVCPVNVLTDTAAWLRRRSGLVSQKTPATGTRYWLFAVLLATSAASGTIAWEWINPITLLHRAIVFGLGSGALAALAVFVYDLVLAYKGWCGHLCPVGAAYSLLNVGGLAKVEAIGRARCNDCLDCYAVCPEPQVIRPALKGQGSARITGIACTTCGRCIDVCDRNVFELTPRFHHRRDGYDQGIDNPADGLRGSGARAAH